MPTKTYYAKLDCLTNVVTAENSSGEYYKSFCDFMSYLTASNVASLVSWNSGSGAVSGSFDTRTYWNGSRPFGLGAHSLWRFHTSSTRNWEWYLYAQVVSGSDSLRQTFNTPVSGYAGAADHIAGTNLNVPRGVIVQAAVCFSGSDSFNPWNGSIGDGNGNASQAAGNGLVRWVSGANDRNLYVLPRSNDVGGGTSTRKDNAMTLGEYWAVSAGGTHRFHFIYDSDSLMVANDIGNNSTYGFLYVGAFELRNILSSSGICGSPYGFLSFVTTPVADSITTNTNFGNTAGTLPGPYSVFNGGIAAPIGEAISGSKTAIAQGINNFLGTTYQPNTLINAYDEIPIYVGIVESPFQSYLGTFNTGLVRYMVNVGSHDMKDDYSRAIVGGSTTLANLKLSIPWTGSIAIGVGTDRTGSNYTWTTNYG